MKVNESAALILTGSMNTHKYAATPVEDAHQVELQ